MWMAEKNYPPPEKKDIDRLAQKVTDRFFKRNRHQKLQKILKTAQDIKLRLTGGTKMNSKKNKLDPIIRRGVDIISIKLKR